MSDFHFQGIRWLFGVNILPRKAILKGRGFIAVAKAVRTSRH
jgi:hypothetical protein